jgi:hypothetical protein
VPTTRRRPVALPSQQYPQQQELELQPLVGVRLIIISTTAVKSFF